MSDQLDPTLGLMTASTPARLQRARPQPAPDPETPWGPWRPPRPQGSQRVRSRLHQVVERLPEPALIHRQGRVLAVNEALTALLCPHGPDGLTGRPAEVLLDRVEWSDPTGRTHITILQTPEGPVRVRLRVLDLALRDDRGVMWSVGQAELASADDIPGLQEHIQTVCARLWEHSEDRRRLRTLTAALDLLDPPDDEPLPDVSDLGALVARLRPDAQVGPAALPVAASDEALECLVAPLLRACAPDVEVSVELDISGHPLLRLSSSRGAPLPASMLAHARVLAGPIGGSVVTWGQGNAVRVRLPPGEPAPVAQPGDGPRPPRLHPQA